MAASTGGTRVAILCGGRSGEHEVSLQSALSIHDALERPRFDPVLVAIDPQGHWRTAPPEALVLHRDDPARIRLNPAAPVVEPRFADGACVLVEAGTLREAARAEVVFPIVHGTDGEDGALQGLLRLFGVPFVGADVLGSAVGMDKDVMKRLLAQAGLPVARWVTLDPREATRVGFPRLASQLGRPLFVKPARMGSSVGVSRVGTAEEYAAALDAAFGYDDKVLVEEAVAGRELECAVLDSPGGGEPRASCAGEVRPTRDFYSYRAKYLDPEAAELVAPAPLEPRTLARVQALAVEVFRALDCAGLARVDLFLKPDGELVVNEINTLPGFTAISMYPRLWALSGVPYPELLTRLVELALERHARRARLNRAYVPPAR